MFAIASLKISAIIPTNWNWQPITPKTLIQNINAEKGLGYQVIPSFLATLLHEKKCIIRSGQREQEIQWRKVQGDGSGRSGLFLVSQAFPALYTDDYGKEREGYFVYRLDFRVQTQKQGDLTKMASLNRGFFCIQVANDMLMSH